MAARAGVGTHDPPVKSYRLNQGATMSHINMLCSIQLHVYSNSCCDSHPNDVQLLSVGLRLGINSQFCLLYPLFVKTRLSCLINLISACGFVHSLSLFHRSEEDIGAPTDSS